MSTLLHHLQSRRLECLCIWDMAVEKMSQFMDRERVGEFLGYCLKDSWALKFMNTSLLASYNPAHLADFKSVS
jgi:hypothetical protein